MKTKKNHFVCNVHKGCCAKVIYSTSLIHFLSHEKKSLSEQQNLFTHCIVALLQIEKKGQQYSGNNKERAGSMSVMGNRNPLTASHKPLAFLEISTLPLSFQTALHRK